MPSNSKHDMGLERLLFFSDAVFAIAITLLVIEIKLPPLPHHAGESELANALGSLIPLFVGFIVSFFLVGQTWIEHHKIGRLLVDFDLGMLWWNLLLLFFVAFMPFTSALLSEHFSSSIALAVYAISFTGLGLAKAAFWRRAVKQRFVAADDATIVDINHRIWATPLTTALIVLAAIANVPFAFLGFMLIPVFAWVLQRIGKSKMKRH